MPLEPGLADHSPYLRFQLLCPRPPSSPSFHSLPPTQWSRITFTSTKPRLPISRLFSPITPPSKLALRLPRGIPYLSHLFISNHSSGHGEDRAPPGALSLFLSGPRLHWPASPLHTCLGSHFGPLHLPQPRSRRGRKNEDPRRSPMRSVPGSRVGRRRPLSPQSSS